MNNPHLAPRTIREWLDLIPFDRARKELEDNIEERFFDDNKYAKASDALCGTFNYSDTIQGLDYWIDFFEMLERMEQSVKLKQKL